MRKYHFTFNLTKIKFSIQYSPRGVGIFRSILRVMLTFVKHSQDVKNCGCLSFQFVKMDRCMQECFVCLFKATYGLLFQTCSKCVIHISDHIYIHDTSLIFCCGDGLHKSNPNERHRFDSENSSVADVRLKSAARACQVSEKRNSAFSPA